MKTTLALALALPLLAGCAAVVVTKTGGGWHAATNPSEIEVLFLRPERPYEELGVINLTDFPARDIAKEHETFRAKAAPLGANAVIITGGGPMGGAELPRRVWATAVAVAWKQNTANAP